MVRGERVIKKLRIIGCLVGCMACASAGWAAWNLDNNSICAVPGEAVQNPGITVSRPFGGPMPFVIWSEMNATGLFSVYVKHWDGANWVPDPLNGLPINLTTGAAPFEPVIAGVDDVVSSLHAAWKEGGQVVSRSYNTVNWVSNDLLASTPNYPVRLTVKGLVYPLLAYHDENQPGQIVVADGSVTGTGFAILPGGLNDLATPANTFDLQYQTPNPNVLFLESGRSLVLKHYTSGLGWVTDSSRLNIARDMDHTGLALAIGGTLVYTAWVEPDAFHVQQLQVKQWDQNAWHLIGANLNMLNDQNAENPTLACTGMEPVVAWEENDTFGYKRIQIKHYNGVAWITEGKDLHKDPTVNASHPNLAMTNSSAWMVWQEGDRIVVANNRIATQVPTHPRTPTPTATPQLTRTTTRTATRTVTPAFGTPTATLTPTNTPLPPTPGMSSTATRDRTAAPAGPKGVFIRRNVLKNASQPVQVTVRFTPPEAIKLAVYSREGNRIKTLFEQNASASPLEVSWDGTNDKGRPVQAGIYLIAVESEQFKALEKVVVVR